jgi:hypothetical protein
VPLLSHLTSCTPTKSNLYLANSLAAAIGEPAPYRLLTFQVRNLMSLFRYLGRTKLSVQVRSFVCKCFVTKIRFHVEELLVPRPTPKLEDHTLSAIRDCLFNTFAATLYILCPRTHVKNVRIPYFHMKRYRERERESTL